MVLDHVGAKSSTWFSSTIVELIHHEFIEGSITYHVQGRSDEVIHLYWDTYLDNSPIGCYVPSWYTCKVETEYSKEFLVFTIDKA